MALPPQCAAVMTQDEKDKFKVLGSSISQQMVASYEVGRRRIPVSMLQALAQALSVAVDDLLGETAKARAERGPAPVLARHVERISALSKPQQKFLIQVLETVLAQRGR